jgi:hypothetical protein
VRGLSERSEFRSARLFRAAQGSRRPSEQAAFSFAAALLVRFLCTLKGIKASKENEHIGKYGY